MHSQRYREIIELNSHFGISAVVVDSGGMLTSKLLEQGLVDEVQLLVAPEIVGKKAINLFRTLKHPVKLNLTDCETIKDNNVILTYTVQRTLKK